MIIFYNKNTGEICGMIQGRVHDKRELEDSSIRPDEVPESEIGKYVVPFKPVFVSEVVKGKRVTRVDHLSPDVEFSSEINELDEGKKKTNDFKLVLSNGKVSGMIVNPNKITREKKSKPLLKFDEIKKLREDRLIEANKKARLMDLQHEKKRLIKK